MSPVGCSTCPWPKVLLGLLDLPLVFVNLLPPLVSLSIPILLAFKHGLLEALLKLGLSLAPGVPWCDILGPGVINLVMLCCPFRGCALDLVLDIPVLVFLDVCGSLDWFSFSVLVCVSVCLHVLFPT